MSADLTPVTGSPFDAIRITTPEGREYWSARELMPLLGYERWERFADAIDRAKIAAHNSGYNVAQNFPGAAKVSGARGPAQQDYHLSRYACYLVAMSGDPRKPEVAAALTYFAIKTREAETRPTPQPLQGADLMAAGYVEAMKQLEARDARIHQLESKVTTDAPKVSYVDTYVTDADLLSFSTVASSNNITEKALRELLIRKDWIYSQSDSRWSERKQQKVTRNRYSEKADKKRYFRRVENHEAPRFRGSEVMHTLKITPQGAEAIARLVAKETAA
ncbi:phage antirepressor KilAC domain-containing protein [Mycolicibacterium phocaicum]|uniref:phage antirepressor KilAC domain-containing protein n=1 Tax=Mycolicibacterium phocaicum TaxID=319706 RepID=UPI001CFB77D8|nr:phage antirepressor KilAC domain-containing protein [Mycolicibacterium phocaicum]UCZ58700.1 phage antirepressor KilAC domain-containing protein [Mycolicibacterium phocaicum]